MPVVTAETPLHGESPSYGVELVITTSKTDDETTEHATAETTEQEGPTLLTRLEIWNLCFSVLAWAFSICNLTLVVGSSNVVVLSIGASPQMSAVPLGTFFIGAALVSLLTPCIFARLGRKGGFVFGICCGGLVGTTLGALSIWLESPPLFIVATLFFGAAMGVAFYLRFAAVEVVPAAWAPKAVTLVVSGGCLAAFAGPESAIGTRELFGSELRYMGLIMMTGIFNVCNLICTLLIQFPKAEEPSSAIAPWKEIRSILASRAFLTPMTVSALSWALMTMPMAILRVAMAEAGYSARTSVLAIELHFLGMYAPGFVSGALIQRWGPRVACGPVAVSLFCAALVFLQNANTRGRPGSEAVWMLGMILIGVAWNFGFSGATVWATKAYPPHCKSVVQAANEFGMFLFAGAWITSSSFIYKAGGGAGLPGWRLVNWVVTALLVLLVLLQLVDCPLDVRRSPPARAEKEQSVEETA